MALATTVGATAKSVVFALNDGTLVYYLLGGETNPMLRFADGKVVMDADVYEPEQIKHFYISQEDDPAAVDHVRTAQGAHYEGHTLTVRGTAAKTVTVCTADGKRVNADVRQTADAVSVSLGNLPEGTYVVSMGNSVYKLYKK